MALGSHEGAHSDFDRANDIEVAATIVIDVNYFKLEVLLLLEVVCHSKARCEIGVQVVVDHLGGGDVGPLAVALLIETALGIRLRKCVQVLKFAT